MEITNITAGPKGIHAKDGELVMLDPNQSADVDVAAADVCKEWFKVSGKRAKDDDDTVSGDPKPLEQMNKATLLETAAAEGVEKAKDKDGNEIAVADATNKEIVAAIKAKRAAA